jgi:cytochrome c oxidase subunit 4
MSEETTTHQHGMSNAGYVRIALILAVITALEVSTYYVDFGPLFMPSLMIMMVVKFFMVATYFMHLKFDNKIFSWMFYAGLFLAVGVYVAALATFKFFIA